MPVLPTVDTRVSRYYLTERLGSGDAGTVFRAEDTKAGRWVAVKFLPEAVARRLGALERFRRDAATLSTLNHPNICTVYEIDQEGDHVFAAMEFLEGTSVEEMIAAGPLPLERLLQIGADVANALAAAHARAIIHGDIKPSNIFLTRRGFAKVLNFGLARTPGAVTGIDGGPVPGMVVGTAYMSPEQVRSEELDARSDLFSLGAVLYEMATGQLPFPGATPGEICRKIEYDEPAPVWTLNSAMPMQLHPVLMKALEKNRDARYQMASQMSTDLQRLKQDAPTGRLAELRTGIANRSEPDPEPEKKGWLKGRRNKNGG